MLVIGGDTCKTVCQWCWIISRLQLTWYALNHEISNSNNDVEDMYEKIEDILDTATTRMWANAQRDGRPAEYRWRPLFNAAKFGWCPLLECPKLANRSQPLVGRSSPFCEDMWERYCYLTSFFPIVDACLSCEDIALQSWAMVSRWRFFASCNSSEPCAVHFRPAF